MAISSHPREIWEQAGRQSPVGLYKSTHPGFFDYTATFDGPSRALGCGQALSRQAPQHSLSTRIALHTGECLIAGEELRGAALEIATAIMQAAEVGEIWLSRTVKELVVGADFSFEERGTLQLKGELGTWQLYKI